MLRNQVHGLSQGTGPYLASRACTCIFVLSSAAIACPWFATTICYWLFFAVDRLKRSFYQQFPKCVEAPGGSTVARRTRAVPAQYSGAFIP